jgi:hypothetical protein
VPLLRYGFRTAALIFAHTLLILESNEKLWKINSQNEYDSKFTFFEHKQPAPFY